MNIEQSLLIFLLLATATTVTINSDSYVDLGSQGYAFSFSDSKGPIQLTITGLP